MFKHAFSSVAKVARFVHTISSMAIDHVLEQVIVDRIVHHHESWVVARDFEGVPVVGDKPQEKNQDKIMSEITQLHQELGKAQQLLKEAKDKAEARQQTMTNALLAQQDENDRLRFEHGQLQQEYEHLRARHVRATITSATRIMELEAAAQRRSKIRNVAKVAHRPHTRDASTQCESAHGGQQDDTGKGKEVIADLARKLREHEARKARTVDGANTQAHVMMQSPGQHVIAKDVDAMAALSRDFETQRERLDAMVAQACAQKADMEELRAVRSRQEQVIIEQQERLEALQQECKWLWDSLRLGSVTMQHVRRDTC